MTGNLLCILGGCFNIMLNIYLFLKLRKELTLVKLRIHLVQEKILNFEPLESGERVLSLENFNKEEGKYYYHISVRDKNYKTKYEIRPSNFDHLQVSPNKPYYGLFGYDKNIWIKSKDGNLLGCTLNKNSKVIYHDYSVKKYFFL